MTKRPNAMKLAVTAAGGRQPVADHFNVTVHAVARWIQLPSAIPARNIRELAALTNGLVSVETLLDCIESDARERKAA
jgi:hypothetical protein